MWNREMRVTFAWTSCLSGCFYFTLLFFHFPPLPNVSELFVKYFRFCLALPSYANSYKFITLKPSLASVSTAIRNGEKKLKIKKKKRKRDKKLAYAQIWLTCHVRKGKSLWNRRRLHVCVGVYQKENGRRRLGTLLGKEWGSGDFQEEG